MSSKRRNAGSSSIPFGGPRQKAPSLQSRREALIALGTLLCVTQCDQQNSAEPLPHYALEVEESHCSDDVVMKQNTLHLRPFARLSVTLRPAIMVDGPVVVRSFLSYPDLPPIPIALTGEERPRPAGTFQLSGRFAPESLSHFKQPHLLFVISRPASLFSLSVPARQVIVLPVELVRD
jgi:hypothetical protein